MRSHTTDWNDAADARRQLPVHILHIDGIDDVDFTTGTVKEPTSGKLECARLLSGGGVQIDIVDGTRTIQQTKIELLDVDGEISRIVATEGPDAPVTSLKNRSVTLSMGFSHLFEWDYAPWAGRIIDIEDNSEHTGYILTLADSLFLTRSKLFTNCDDKNGMKVSFITGNIVNVYASLLTGVFSLSGDWPLTYIATGTTSAGMTFVEPTGLGLDASMINAELLAAQRETPTGIAHVGVAVSKPEECKPYLERELFRAFQAVPTISGGGLIGLKFLMPPFPTDDTPELLEDDHIISVSGWRRRTDMHLNKFRYVGDYEAGQGGVATASPGEYPTVFYDTVTDDDAADQVETKETNEYFVESQWMRASFDGAALTRALAGRARSRHLKMPATMNLKCELASQRIEEGDVVRVTHRAILDLATGTRGVTAKPMIVLSRTPDNDAGTLVFEVMDASFQRYGLIAPDDCPNYEDASPTERQQYFFICNDDAEMANGDPAYRFM